MRISRYQVFFSFREVAVYRHLVPAEFSLALEPSESSIFRAKRILRHKYAVMKIAESGTVFVDRFFRA